VLAPLVGAPQPPAPPAAESRGRVRSGLVRGFFDRPPRAAPVARGTGAPAGVPRRRPLSPAGSPPAAQLEPKRARQFGALHHYGSDYGASGSDEGPGSGDVSMVEEQVAFGGAWQRVQRRRDRGCIWADLSWDLP
jgi:hypothetical protein